jgi:hypothetical protein
MTDLRDRVVLVPPSVSAPRVLGPARLGEAFPVDRLPDVVVSRQADRVRRIPARVVAERTR